MPADSRRRSFGATSRSARAELVGEIFSEHLTQTPRLVRVAEDGSARVSGQAPIREVERALDIDLPKGSWTTIGGLCLALAGRVRCPSDRWTLPDGTELAVVEATARRVQTVLAALGSDELFTDPSMASLTGLFDLRHLACPPRSRPRRSGR